MNNRLQLALHPPATAKQADTSLRYTDILFGFVIRELFLRLQNLAQLNSGVRWHLIVGITLVLGSWIGFRRSLNRTTYDVKFFNLPLFLFLLDQMILILYFRIAVLTNQDGTTSLRTASELAANTGRLVMYVFILYVAWDVLVIWLANAKRYDESTHRKMPRYPDPESGKKTPADWPGLCISASTLVVLIVLRRIADALYPECLFIAIVLLLLAYRAAKEIQTSWQT